MLTRFGEAVSFAGQVGCHVCIAALLLTSVVDDKHAGRSGPSAWCRNSIQMYGAHIRS